MQRIASNEPSSRQREARVSLPERCSLHEPCVGGQTVPALDRLLVELDADDLAARPLREVQRRPT